MAVLTLGAVFAQVRNKYQLKLLAGEAGLHRSLRYIYFSEDIGAEDFIRGGELVVFTGFSFESEAEFEDYVRMLIRKNCCGVILNVGKYLFEETISPELLALCEEARFPLISMPWKHHLTDILREFSHHIFLYRQEQAQASYVFQTRLEGERPFSEEDELRLSANHFDPQGEFCVCVLEVKGDSSLSQELCVLAENQLNRTEERSCALSFRGRVVLIFHEAEEIHSRTERVLALCAKSFPGHKIFCGRGCAVSGAERLRQSYDQALAALRYGERQGVQSLSFDALDEFRLFYNCRDRSILEQFCEILAPLKANKSQFGEDFQKTLRLFLEFDGSIQRICEVLGYHRNTINYRMNRVEELLSVDLEDRQTRFQLQLAFLIEDYLTLYPAEPEG